MQLAGRLLEVVSHLIWGLVARDSNGWLVWLTRQVSLVHVHQIYLLGKRLVFIFILGVKIDVFISH